MATVIKLLSENPPEGWNSEILNSHSSNGIVGKLMAWKRAKKYLRSQGHRFDIIHLHSASDWSFRRKCSMAKIAKVLGVPCIMHIHSGGLTNWARNRNLKHKIHGSHIVSLTSDMACEIEKILGESIVIPNPVIISDFKSNKRDQNKLLLLGRKDEIKGHEFAINLVRKLLSDGLPYSLDMTGIIHHENGIIGHGWVDEQKKEQLLDQAGILLVPSQFEGQPMVILEACARGLPVIASEITVPDGVIRVPLGDVDAWIAAIRDGGGVGDVSQSEISAVQRLWKELYSSIVS